MLSRVLSLVSLVAFLASCGGGGGGGGGQQPGAVFAGANLTVDAGTRVYVTPAAAESAGVQSFTWTQTAGPAAPLESDPRVSPDVLVARAPSFASVVEFQVTGRRADGSVAGTDRVTITVESVRPAATGATLSTVQVRGGGAGRAARAVLHRETERLFVLDAVAGDVVCYDVSDPAAPSLVGALPIPDDGAGFMAGAPLALACGDTGPLAITWSGKTIKFPGRLQFIDPVTLQELRAISTVGVRPVAVDTTPDGSLFAVACAGDRDFIDQADGIGFVTLVQVPPSGPGSITLGQHVTPLPLTAFDGSEPALAAEGVRFPSPGAQAALALAPRAVAVAPDGSVVWVACPENDALITVDPAMELVTGITAMPDRANGDLSQGTRLAGSRIGWSTAPVVAVSPAGDEVPLGGVAGILPPSGSGTLRFVTGSGPTLEPVDVDSDGRLELPFVDPTLGLAVEEVRLDGPAGAVETFGRLPLTSSVGTPILGTPNIFTSSPGLALYDEEAVDLTGAPIPPSSRGGRFEGATETPNGDLWLADARRCSLWRFNRFGALVARYTPSGTPGILGGPELPAVFGQRRVNLDFPRHRRFGGFGAIAYDPRRGSILAIPRLPLDNPDTPADQASAASRILRILELDLGTLDVSGEYVYVLEAADHAVEGLAAGPTHVFAGGLAVLEAGLEDDGLRAVFDLDLSDATNLRSLTGADYASVSAVLEGTGPGALADLAVPIVPARKRLALDLAEAGFGGPARPSALLVLGDDEVLVGFDDGFAGTTSGTFDPATGALQRGTPPGSFLVRGTIEPLRFDTAVDGLPAPPADGVPAVALPQPLDLVAVGAGADLRVVTANGGRARVLPDSTGGPGYDERIRAGSQVLDTMVFPDAAGWRRDPFGGDLTVSLLDSDRDGDGLVDRLAIFGGRSLSVADADLAVRWTSASDLVDRAREARPGRVDGAATGSGLRPRALASAVVAGRELVATAYQGAGLVGVHLVDHPDAPLFAGFVGTADDPVDVDLRASAGGGTGLLAVTDAARGAVTLVRVGF